MTPADSRLFAIIPAAGHSRRMGQPKLLLPLGSTSIIGRLLDVLTTAAIDAFVLVRPGDDTLRAEAAAAGAVVVQPSASPAQMRISVELLLQAVAQQRSPQPRDGWLLIPADHPLMSPATLRRLVTVWQQAPGQIVLPSFNGRRGHPTLLPWSLAQDVPALPSNVGINRLIRMHTEMVTDVPVDDPTVIMDIDTPEDYERAQQLLDDSSLSRRKS